MLAASRVDEDYQAMRWGEVPAGQDMDRCRHICRWAQGIGRSPLVPQIDECFA